MTINILHHGFELTPAIRDYVEEKMLGLEKFHAITHVDVEVGTEAGKFGGDTLFCKAVVQVPGTVIKVEREAEDLYKAIDKVRDHLRMELTQRKEKEQERQTGKG
jgi:putative sigma-54 modulation protein